MRLYHVLACLLLIGGLVACTSDDSSLEGIQERGELIVGMDASYPPFEFVNNEDQIVGFDVDLAREIADRLGVEVRFRNIAYDGLYDALLIGDVDILISALVAAPEFAGRANFSVPYFNIGEHLIVPTGSDISRMDDLDGQRLGVEFGAGGDVEARKWERRLSDLSIERYATPEEAVIALEAGAVDAALVDGITAYLTAGQNDDIMIATNVVDSLLAVAVHPESEELLAQIDRILDEMKQDGTLETLIVTWFGEDDA